jgi:hypothetical protein
MSKTLTQKNRFVTELRDYLQEKYRTKEVHTYGDEGFESRKTQGAYCLVRTPTNKPSDISGFCFRKDLCSWPPRTEKQLLDDVKDFASRTEGLEAKFEQNRGILKMTFEDTNYLVHPHIDQGHAGEISIYFTNVTV